MMYKFKVVAITIAILVAAVVLLVGGSALIKKTKSYFSPAHRVYNVVPVAAYDELAGKPLRYLIGGNAGLGRPGEITVVSYTTSDPVKNGISVAYANLFDETNSGKYEPYLHTSDTAAQYGEGQIDPTGPGWEKNLREQFERRRAKGFKYIELDNPDAYHPDDVYKAYDLAASYGFKILAKNPGISDRHYDNLSVVAHPAVVGIIVEKSNVNAAGMDKLRQLAGKPDLPIWYVTFGRGKAWAQQMAKQAKNYREMRVTYSTRGEYGNSVDIK